MHHPKLFGDLTKNATFKWRNRFWKKLQSGSDTVQGPGTGAAMDQKGNIRIFGNKTPVTIIVAATNGNGEAQEEA